MAGMVAESNQTDYPKDFEDDFQKFHEHFPVLKKTSLRKMTTKKEANFGTVWHVEGIIPQLSAALLVNNTEDKRTQVSSVDFALKKMTKEKVFAGRQGLESAANELGAALHMYGLNLNFIAKTFGVAQDADHFYLMTEYCKHGDLLGVLKKVKAGRIAELGVREIVFQLLLAVKELHIRGVVHRDLSPENIGVAEDGTMRIIDFGQAMCVHAPYQEQDECWLPPDGPGKYLYRAPEMNQKRPYLAKKGDMFAIGMMTYVLLTGTYLYTRGNQGNVFKARDMDKATADRVIDRLQERHPLTHACITDNMKDFLKTVMAPCASKRLSVHEALSHPWIVGGVPAMLGDADDMKSDEVQ